MTDLPERMHGYLCDVSQDVQRALQYLRFDRDSCGELLIRGYDLSEKQFEIVNLVIERGIERRVVTRSNA